MHTLLVGDTENHHVWHVPLERMSIQERRADMRLPWIGGSFAAYSLCNRRLPALNGIAQSYLVLASPPKRASFVDICPLQS